MPHSSSKEVFVCALCPPRWVNNYQQPPPIYAIIGFCKFSWTIQPLLALLCRRKQGNTCPNNTLDKNEKKRKTRESGGFGRLFVIYYNFIVRYGKVFILVVTLSRCPFYAKGRGFCPKYDWEVVGIYNFDH